MTRFDAIVVGGGINGLVAGAVLARRGKSVCILERSQHLGGMAAADPSGAPKLAHLLYNLSPAVRQEIGLNKANWPFQTHSLPTLSLCPTSHHVLAEGTDVRFADGTVHPDANAFRDLTNRLTRYADVLRGLAEGPPPGGAAPLMSAASLTQLVRLARVGLGARRLGKAEMRSFLQVLLSNAYDLILDEMTDGPLAGMLAADAVRGTAMGPRSPGTVFTLLYRMGHGGVPLSTSRRNGRCD